MKQRLLVMNGQRILQAERGERQWETIKVDKAMGIKPGIYDLHLARLADKSLAYDGVALFANKDHVFQLVGKAVIKHDRDQFESVPDTGTNLQIAYGPAGKAIVATASIKTGRGRSR